jgi:hypothetical protein
LVSAGAALADEIERISLIPAAISAVTAPAIGSVNKSPKATRAAKRDARLVFRLAEPALVTVRDKTS